MIFKDALLSLKNSMTKAVFYWLTFVLTSMFIFLFFNISMSESLGFTWVDNNNDTVTTITVFVIAICLIIIFFANDFFVKNKAKELAVRLVCGATFLQLAEYLLIQTFILLLIAIPFGIIGAIALVPVLNAIISSILKSPFVIGIYPQAVLTTFVILSAVVFWTTYLNLSFAYRNSAAMLMNERKMINPLSGVSMIENNWLLTEKEKEEKKKEREERIRKGANRRRILALVLFLMPIPVFFINKDMTFIFAIIGMVGLWQLVPNVIVPYLNTLAKDKKTNDPLLLASIGFYRADITILRPNIILFLACAILLVSILLGRDTTQLEMMLSLLSYVVMNVLLSMAIMFKFSTELFSRQKYYLTLDQLGYTSKDRKEVSFREVTALYLTIFLIALLYLGSIFLSMILRNELTVQYALLLLLFLAIPLLICWIITVRIAESNTTVTETKRQ